MSESQLKLEAEIRALYSRYQALKSEVAAVNATTHLFITELDLFIVATGIAEKVGLSLRSWSKWNKTWNDLLKKAEVFVEGKKLEYGITEETQPEPQPEPEESANV
jgi:hypothetical protein